MDPFTEQALQFILGHRLVEPHQNVLVAVSGGSDSVALLNLLVSLRAALEIERLTVAHFDHGLRGHESDEDRAFVELLAQRLGLPFFWRAGDVEAFRQEQKLSVEMAARTCRHRFFAEAMSHLGANVLALGHTANDQAEELLLRLLRGTGPAGLSGMLPRGRQGIIRPLLFSTRNQVLDYLNRRKIPFREDSSNATPSCLRNSLRLEVLPVVEKRFHPRVVETLCRHARLAQDEEDYWTKEVEKCWPVMCTSDQSGIVLLNVLPVRDLHPALQRRVVRRAIESAQGSLQGVYSTHIENICRWIHSGSQSSELHLPRGLRLVRSADQIIFGHHVPQSDLTSTQDADPLVMNNPGRYAFLGRQLDLKLTDVDAFEKDLTIHASKEQAWIDADKIRWPLTLRTWQPGDRFQPLGLQGSKKLQDFFVDTKIPASQRNSIPLLCDAEKICWIVGYRLDDRVKVTLETKIILVAKHFLLSNSTEEH